MKERESGFHLPLVLNSKVFVHFELPEDIYGCRQFVKSVQFGVEETCLARVAEMETDGLDYTNSQPRSKLSEIQLRNTILFGSSRHKYLLILNSKGGVTFDKI